jgi:thiamine biosynthesis lipoprotein
VQLDAEHQRALQPGGVYLDLSAIAKGFGVDQVARYLSRQGVDSYLVEVGGELRGVGIKPDALPWWVELEQPSPLQQATQATQASAQTVIALHGLSVATSGDYRRYFTVHTDGQTTHYSHTIDPRSGEPIQHGLAAVTVIHRDCITADAVSTALNVLGVEHGMAFAIARSIPALFITRTINGFAEHITPEFTALLQ